ncbi:MAG: MinD/ParA family protein [Defluviicoccus sp.]|nr:MAG: MinD/ParA family protein [Defluviicoccus sp.]
MSTATSPAADLPASLPRPNANKLLAIASGKGGVGKTCLAISIAHALARRGRRTLLFDADLGLANVDIQLGLMPSRDLGGVVTGRLTLAEATTPFDAGGFDIVAGRSGCGRLAGMPPARLALLGEQLLATAETYDHVLLDLGAGLEQTVRQFSQLAGSCAVVTTDEPTAITDAYAFIKMAQADRTPSAMRIIVNMATSRRDGERTFGALLRACESFLKVSPELLGIVRRDLRVREAIRCQTPLLTRFPTCEAAADVEAIAARLPAA